MAPDKVVWLIRLLFAALALAAVGWFIVRPVWRMLRTKPDLGLLLPDYHQGLEGEELQIPEDPHAGVPDRQTLIERARTDPNATALMVQRWLKDKR